MTLQNRVMPDGSIIATPDRGTLMGNRGILHDGQQTLGAARWRHQNWISCELSFANRRRQIMRPGHYTELFFLDEAVALAAGHRPCAECRRVDYTAFRAAWTAAFGATPDAPGFDRILHAARVNARTRTQITHEAPAETLPDGTFISQGNDCLLILGTSLLPFSPAGYGTARKRPEGRVAVLTPKPLVAMLAAGYRPRLHPTAG